ncbi:hypothetical protein HDU96_010121 [Phlyctochytrium bullatum]|nr:hypothetical protein HDU96_010121 [Phlyctochytrium bullatum]
MAAAVGSLLSFRVLLDHYPIELPANESELFRIAAVNGSTNIVKFLLSHLDSSFHAIRTASEIASPDLLHRRLRSILDPNVHGDHAFRWACFNRQVNTVKLLLDHSLTATPLGIPCVDPSADYSMALRNACFKGHVNVVKLLLDHSVTTMPLGVRCVDASLDDSAPLRRASARGYSYVVELLLDHSLKVAPSGFPCSDPSVLDNECLRQACEKGYVGIVKMLIDHSLAAAALGIPGADLSVNNSQVLREACFFGHTRVVKLLLDHRGKVKPLGFPCVDLASWDNEALRDARSRGFDDIPSFGRRGILRAVPPGAAALSKSEQSDFYSASSRRNQTKKSKHNAASHRSTTPNPTMSLKYHNSAPHSNVFTHAVIYTGTAEEETRRCMDQLKKVLGELGLHCENLVRVNLYITDVNDLAKINEVYASYFPNKLFPARTCVIVAALIGGARIEIEATAKLQKASL